MAYTESEIDFVKWFTLSRRTPAYILPVREVVGHQCLSVSSQGIWARGHSRTLPGKPGICCASRMAPGVLDKAQRELNRTLQRLLTGSHHQDPGLGKREVWGTRLLSVVSEH